MNQSDASHSHVMPMLLGHQDSEDSQFSAASDSVGESSHKALCSLQNQELSIAPSGNEHGDYLLKSFFTTEYIFDNGQLQNGQVETLASENEHKIASCEQLILSWECANSALNGNIYRALKNEQNDKNPHVKSQKQKITREDIQSLFSRNMKLVDAAKELGVSRSTMTRKLRELGIKWQSSRKAKQSHDGKRHNNNKVPTGSNFPQQRLMNPTYPIVHENAIDSLDHEPHHMLSDLLPVECNPIANSTVNARTGTIGAPHVTTQCETDDHENAPEILIVKTMYKEDVVRFGFSSTGSVAELKEEVAKNLELELGSFKIKYQDEENEWMLLTREEHLSYVLGLTKSSSNKIVRLAIFDL